MTDNEFLIEHNRNETFLWYKRKYERYETFLDEVQKLATVGASNQMLIEIIEKFKREQDNV